MAPVLPWAVLALSAVGTGLAVKGMIDQSHAAKQQGVAAVEQAAAQTDMSQYQAQVARNNATSAKNNATYAMQVGEVDATTEGLKGRSRLGAIKAAQAANGLDVNTGSAVDVRAGEAAAARQDVLTTRSNAALKAYGYRTDAANFEAQAGLHDREALYATKAGEINKKAADTNAKATLLGGASGLAFKWSSALDNFGGGGASPGSTGGLPLDSFGRPED